MKKNPLVFIFSLFFVFNLQAQTGDPNLGIIPAPKSVVLKSGQFQINKNTVIQYAAANDKAQAELFQLFLKEKYALNLPLTKSSSKKAGVIRFTSVSYSGTNPEGYLLNINPELVTISGKGAGLFYGLQSLLQIVSQEQSAGLNIPCAEIVDAPRFQYRGMHLDVALHFFPVSFVKKFIDMMAQYKLNTFQWHLTEDQGWRIEIKKYPELTKSGAWRAQTLIGNLQNPLGYDGIPHGGFYTQEEIRDVVAYAAARHVNIIPEIELPGHCIAALVAYPQLACNNNPGPFKVVEGWGIYDEVFCAGKESTFEFLEDVFTEVMELFPSKYIHIGGDEARKKRWKACDLCQKRIKDNGLKNEHELQSYFVQRVEKFLNSKGRSIIGWDEILEGGLAPNATVMSWRGEKGGIAAAKLGHDVVMAPTTAVYFDFAQNNAEQEPLTIGNFLPIDKVYSYNPVPDELTEEQKKHIIGVEACVWTEYMKTPAKVEYMILPRMYALSEIAWSPLEKKNYKNFSEERLPIHLGRLDKTETLYFVPPAIGIRNSGSSFNGALNGSQITVSLKPSVAGAKIFYTFDDIDPRETDLVYERPITIKIPEGDKRILKTIVITPSGKRSAVTRTVYVNSQVNRP
ncbi:MAG TPA: family 20 glycosylhydrolase [Sphingobacteriaceae bacterium]